MIFVQLAVPVNGFDRVNILEFHAFDIFDTVKNYGIGFRYQIYSVQNNSISALYDRYYSITEAAAVSTILNATYTGLTGSECMTRAMLEYLIAKNLITGTIERG